MKKKIRFPATVSQEIPQIKQQSSIKTRETISFQPKNMNRQWSATAEPSKSTPNIHWPISTLEAVSILKKYNEALTSINTALEIDPKCADAHCHLGIVLGDIGKYNEAI